MINQKNGVKKTLIKLNIGIALIMNKPNLAVFNIIKYVCFIEL